MGFPVNRLEKKCVTENTNKTQMRGYSLDDVGYLPKGIVKSAGNVPPTCYRSDDMCTSRSLSQVDNDQSSKLDLKMAGDEGKMDSESSTEEPKTMKK